MDTIPDHTIVLTSGDGSPDCEDESHLETFLHQLQHLLALLVVREIGRAACSRVSHPRMRMFRTLCATRDIVIAADRQEREERGRTEERQTFQLFHIWDSQAMTDHWSEPTLFHSLVESLR
jgi:hypothetical protein